MVTPPRVTPRFGPIVPQQFRQELVCKTENTLSATYLPFVFTPQNFREDFRVFDKRLCLCFRTQKVSTPEVNVVTWGEVSHL